MKLNYLSEDQYNQMKSFIFNDFNKKILFCEHILRFLIINNKFVYDWGVFANNGKNKSFSIINDYYIIRITNEEIYLYDKTISSEETLNVNEIILNPELLLDLY